jgi:hypothetical protein
VSEGPLPVLITNPRNDDVFRAAAHAALGAGASSPGALHAALRPQYPHVLVRPRALSAEPATVWYVYREGRWTR